MDVREVVIVVMITLSMATACIGTGGNGVIVDEGTGWREGGREGGSEGEREEGRVSVSE